MLDTATHQRFIDRQQAVVKESKQDVITAALRVVTPRRLLTDPVHAREMFIDIIMQRSHAAFKRIAAIGAEFADVKRA